MSATPSRAWSINCAGEPPSCIDGKIWHLSSPADSASIFAHHGVMNLACAVEPVGRK